ncbi:MAG: putative toxin-antitoxin system toxin component, PIN family [Candidatus Omnitrophica bacterium]|nr:putative toxin-antitoxin system toxin component, PIN family [Candidatus Omnitrophota bacterium]MBU1524259.1 putative toxin-antitoxin system toxin component, PIN family [Candidatus Omnitrophota bacterium]MBU1809973.1 putative toxin-antitoxin system toxin component, PIN family [Candidatus Omnitrophota bacterium]
MKIFFDTNVIISGFISRGYTFDVIKDAIFRHEVYYTEYLLKEAQENLSTKFPLSNEAVDFIIYNIKRHFIKGRQAGTIDKVCRDDKDNQILADALASGIEIIVTGDKDLLTLQKYQGIKIILPRDYWKL